MYAYIDSFRKFGKTNTDNQSIKIKRPYPCGVASLLLYGAAAGVSAARYSCVACHHAVCCLVRVASLVLGSEVVMPEKVRIAFAPLDIE